MKSRALHTAGGVFMLVTDSPESQLGLWLLLTISFAKSVVAGLSGAVRLGGIWVNLIPLCRKNHCETHK